MAKWQSRDSAKAAGTDVSARIASRAGDAIRQQADAERVRVRAVVGEERLVVLVHEEAAPLRYQRITAAPQVKPEPNTVDSTRSPFFTLPCWRQWSMVSGTVAAVVLP